jgi:beta-xylosidase
VRALPAIVAALLTGVLGVSVEAQTAVAIPLATAVFAADFPDPSVLRIGDVYYGYGTTTPWEAAGHIFPILTSTDLRHWSAAGDVFGVAPSWASDHFWAPSVVAHSGTYFVYYSALMAGGDHCLAVATASNPLGPFADHGPLACDDGPDARGFIDASPLLVGDQAYLYFSVDGPSHHSISVVPLSSDLLHVAGPRTELFGVTEAWESGVNGTVEGPSPFRWGDSFVVLYSGGDWRRDYAMGYATANSPLGPFIKHPGPFLQGGGGLKGPGGGSFFTDSDGQPWLAFHAWADSGRELHVGRLGIRVSQSGPDIALAS